MHPKRLSLSLLAVVASAVSPYTAAASTTSAASCIDYRYFVAGGTCAAISHGITTPIDVVKTRM
jgi:solute carrier family 25 phosphate transporter 3